MRLPKRRGPEFLQGLAGSWVAMLAVVCTAPAQAARPPNVLLIVSEDNGPELGCYGDPHARTPNLDRLAAEGVRFERAFVPYSVCSPSRACYFTGLHAHENGHIGLATHKFALYRENTPNLVTLLRPAGYFTGIIGKLHVNPASAFPFDFSAIPGANFDRKKNSEDYVAKAEAFWEQAEDRPWMLSVNFPDAHLPFLRRAGGRPEAVQTGEDVSMLPWVGAESERLLEVTADYYNCLARLDSWVGMLLESLEHLGEAEETLVIYIGDHGAQFPRGKGTVYEGGLRVPFLLRWPGHATAGLAREELVSTLDILPTILEATGVEGPPNRSGRALQPLLRGEEPKEWRRYIYAMTTGAFPRNCFVRHSIRDSRYKLILTARPGMENRIAGSYLDEKHPHFVVPGVRSEERRTIPPKVEAAFQRWERPPRHELYDLEDDPHEWTNLAERAEHVAVRERLLRTLEQFRTRTRDPFLDPAIVEAFVDEQLENRDLRYRKEKDFRWSYLETFPRWREAHP